MSALDSATIIGGPAIITFNGATIYTEDDVVVRVKKTLKGRNVSGFGKVDDTLLDVIAEVTCKPVQWKNLSVLLPYFATPIGARIAGGTDKPLVIQSMTEGRKYTYARALITGLPNLGLGVEKDLLGSMTFTCLKGNAIALSAANSIVALATTAFADTSFDRTKLYDIPFGVTVGAGAILNAADTESGADITWSLTLEPVKSDAEGTLDMKLVDLQAVVKFTPVGITAANLLLLSQMQGTGVRRGVKMSTLGVDILLAGYNTGDPTVLLTQCYPEESGDRHGVKPNLPGELSYRASKKFTAGAAQPIVVIGTAA